jgi:hypothetical protein
MVEALYERKLRGNFLPLNEERQKAFAEQTDRVRLFLAEHTRPGGKGPRCITRANLYPMFCNWADAEHAGKAGRILGKHKFNDRVRLAGVAEFKPPSGSWCWDLIEVDPETADDGGSKLPTAPDCDQVPVQKSDVIDQSASSEPKLPTKTADSEIAGMVGVLPMPMGVVTAVSAVLPYCTNPDRKPQLNSKQPQWVKTAEIAEDFLPALAVDPSVWTTPAEPLLLSGSTDPLVVDLETCSADQLWKTHYKGAKPLILEPTFIQSYSLYLMVFAICVIVIALIWYFRLHKIIIPSKQVDSLFPLINRFTEIGKNKISLDELDEIFEINHMESESKKSKRHRMLKNIEQKYPGFILREKDELDRRKFSYNLDFQALKQKK